jgi:hypothetical protein
VRYYRIEIEGGPTYTSFENGVTNPNALQVEMDIPVAPFASPAAGGAYVKVWGIPLADISQANNLRFKNIKVYGGFQKGLPLANPAQAGLLVQGYIWQPFGNWIGVDQTLDLVILPGAAPSDQKNVSKPMNLSLNWKKGQLLSDALKTMLTTAYPGYTVNANVNPNLKVLQDEPAFFNSLEEAARYVKSTSRGIINTDGYPGVDITLVGTTFNIRDNTAPAQSSSSGNAGGNAGGNAAGTKTVSFQDLIGQPTWIEAPDIQFKTMMRADLQVGDQITLPKTQVTNSAQAASSLINQNVSFQGGFQITSMRHVGNFRQALSDAWVTVFNATPQQVQSQS